MAGCGRGRVIAYPRRARFCSSQVNLTVRSWLWLAITGSVVSITWDQGSFARDRRFADSPLEEAGFELPVPREIGRAARAVSPALSDG
jgi:hypothetical protein